MAASAPVGGF
jgi:hypothetical protein